MARKKRCHGCERKYAPQPLDRSFQNWCSYKCGVIVAKRRVASARERAKVKAIAAGKKEAKVNKKALLELNRRSVPWQHKLTQRVFNRMRVLEELECFNHQGLEPRCISCKKPRMDWSCGHYVSVGASGALRYDRVNTYLQCNKFCNSSLSSNRGGTRTTVGYDQGLLDRFGEREGQDIIDYCKSNTGPRKWGWEELEEMRRGFAARVRELEKL